MVREFESERNESPCDLEKERSVTPGTGEINLALADSGVVDSVRASWIGKAK